jgi:hypothetical protein
MTDVDRTMAGSSSLDGRPRRTREEVINVTMQSTAVLRQLARDREATLRATALRVRGEPRRRPVRQWLGRQLVRTGTWLANEQPMRPAGAR